ncbi:hypothetical protein IQ241_20480 [Romeria aff. gracilis LEGE 07310]|uniref:Uncharacterized protein n=1 Tax=Vasconcelosia minhoensis LEGE 07310 TaxID=915328 RepID=A0A8J7DPG1_9CYAN|nr:hypothetical protein [Romeria gracilis]MBE9079640.1 hypothetical protein [Romeria aff. gracilis LEGE 07310]
MTVKFHRSAYFFRSFLGFIGTLLFIFGLAIAPAALGQLPQPKIERLANIYSADDATDFTVGNVHLDGRQVFALAAPALNQEQQDALSISPIRQRVQTIRSQLQETAKSTFDTKTLEVNYTIDTATRLPVISVNGNYLMTVTTADARLYGVDPTTHAENLTQVIKEAILTSQQEH